MTAFGDEFGPVFQGNGNLDDAVAKWQTKLVDYGKQQGFTVTEQ